MQMMLIAADEIYSAALQILNHYGVEAKAVPLIVETAAHRLESFAVGAMARELAELSETKEPENSEVGNG